MIKMSVCISSSDSSSCALSRVNNLCISSPALIKPTYKSVRKKTLISFIFPSLCDTSHLTESVFIHTNSLSKKSAKRKKFFPPLALCLSVSPWSLSWKYVPRRFLQFFSVTRSLRCRVAWQLPRATRQLYRIQVLFSAFVFV